MDTTNMQCHSDEFAQPEPHDDAEMGANRQLSWQTHEPASDGDDGA